MRDYVFGIIVTLALISVASVYLYKRYEDNRLNHYHAMKALEILEKDADNIPEVPDDFLKINENDIIMMKTPADKEKMTFFHPINTRYWPYYHYTYPYQYLDGGGWPPNLYSRFYQWQPGYNTHGWSYWLRPGVYYDKWPTSRWVRNNGTYYYINNGKDRSRDYYNI